MKKDVSCRIILGTLDYLEKCQIAPETLCAGVPYPVDYLRDRHNRIEWDVYCRMNANLRQIWSDEDFVRMGFEITKTVPFRSITIIANLLFKGPDIYLWWTSGASSPGRQLFSCITPAIERRGKNHILLTLTLPPGYQYCREFFVITKGTMAAGTAAMGLGPARVSMRETERGAIYDIICPEGGGALSWLRRAIMWPFAARAAARELKEANEKLHERYAQLEEAREKVQHQATQLKVAYDISRLIRANLDLDSTLEAIARSLVTVAGFAAAALSLDTLSEHEPVKRAVKAGVELRDSARLIRTLDSHGVKFGDVTLWMPPGSDHRAVEELLDYVIPAIAMEIDNALSFKLVNDYRNSLQRKVEERTQELKEMNESLKKGQAGRDRLFSNISHEFRTPLTLILGPLEKILEESRGAKMRGRLGLIRKSAQKLLQLINQLLELSRLQSGDVTLHASQFDLVPFLREVVMSYRSLADTRHIRLTFRADGRSLALYLDREKAETLFNNLLVNAFKFTPDGGRIDVAVHKLESVAEVVIKDSGVGIAENELPFIFDRFYQGRAVGDHNIGGTGIGLALTKELTELHHGTIRVSSTAGIGTEFVVSLPLGRAHLSDKECVEQPGVSLSTKSQSTGESSAETKSQTDVHRIRGERIVLVIDDDPDVRRYIKDIVSADMQVIEAGDGEEGIRCAQKLIPDLIISDIMMPKRDGNELCRILKEDIRTSHIPIILLTARAGTENRIEGLEKGADDYVIKPFVARELLARVKNLIALRETLRKRFSSERLLKSAELLVPSMDQGFLQKAMEIVDRHMSDEGFGIDDFSREIGLSRTQLHRKLVALTDCSARDFLRRLRLERASDLLHRNTGNISEIAYQVGFRDPSHFAKCFRKQFGVPPGAVRPSARMSPMKG